LGNIEIVLNLDLVGSGSGGLQIWNGNAANTAKTFNLFDNINKKEFYFYKLIAAEDRCISDHCSFKEVNIPAVFLMTLGEEHKWSHSIYDSYENLPFTKYESLFRIIRDFVNQYR
jgi:Zn-dependent M28 family amino/carboxypeptidase